MPYANNIADFWDLTGQQPLNKKILVEGDSWVSHPQLWNLTGQFEDLGERAFNLLNLGVPGDTAARVIRKGTDQFDTMEQLLSSTRYGDKFDMVMLSAAGNDIVGPEILGYVDRKTDNPGYGRALINQSYYDMLALIRKDYEGFLAMRDRYALNRNTPVITQVYSYLTPRKLGTNIFGRVFTKGWIAVHLETLGIFDEAEWIDIAAGLLDGFYDEMSKISAKRFLVADTRKVLSKGGKPDVSLWHDEMHPTSAGFRKVAKKIRDSAVDKKLWPK